MGEPPWKFSALGMKLLHRVEMSEGGPKAFHAVRDRRPGTIRRAFADLPELKSHTTGSPNGPGDKPSRGPGRSSTMRGIVSLYRFPPATGLKAYLESRWTVDRLVAEVSAEVPRRQEFVRTAVSSRFGLRLWRICHRGRGTGIHCALGDLKHTL